ncbi:MAG TPA: glycosyltransferase [Steroidobacteraceae bacterium]|nr:glycosyltransferase [Steroidobacteraceae bacterium]
MSSVALSVVIPVYNEEAGLNGLFARLYPALDALKESYEIVFVDDGSKDKSVAIMREQFRRRPDVTRVVILALNAGQHNAIMAGFTRTRGKIVVTLDADLQNPPEEIGKLVAKMREGYDYVGSYRRERQDSGWRKWPSKLLNRIRESTTRIRMRDQGCMLRAYGRDIIDAINQSREVNVYIPALAYTFSRTPTEIEVEHESRAAGESKYSLFKLLRLNFDLMTGFSLAPLQLFSMIGIGIALLSGLFVIFLALRRIFVGPEVEGLFTLFGIVFFLLGITLFGVGILGEYVGRIYQQVQGRPRFIIGAVLEKTDSDKV